jgi:hypothetical protein
VRSLACLAATGRAPCPARHRRARTPAPPLIARSFRSTQSASPWPIDIPPKANALLARWSRRAARARVAAALSLCPSDGRADTRAECAQLTNGSVTSCPWPNWPEWVRARRAVTDTSPQPTHTGATARRPFYRERPKATAVMLTRRQIRLALSLTLHGKRLVAEPGLQVKAPSRPVTGTAHGSSPLPIARERKLNLSRAPLGSNGAEDEIRTRDPLLGKEVLYR